MRIGVDMDGIVADFTPKMIKHHNLVHNLHDPTSGYSVYDLTQPWQCSYEEMVKRIHEFYRSDLFKTIQPVKGAKTGIRHLSKKHELVLVTSRPYFIEQLSIDWLDQYFPGHFKKIVHTNQITQRNKKRRKKSEICLEEKIDLMIDDALEFAVDCATAGIKVLLFDAIWNQEKNLHQNITRIFGWKNIHQHL